MNVIELISKNTQDFLAIPAIRVTIETNNEKYHNNNIFSPLLNKYFIIEYHHDMRFPFR